MTEQQACVKKGLLAALLVLQLTALSDSASAQQGDEILVFRDSCAAVASSIVSAAANSNSVSSLGSNTKAAYLRLASAPGINVLPLHRIEEPIDILLRTYGGQVLDEIRGGMYSANLDQFVRSTGYAMAFTSATCMAILMD